MPIRRSFAVMPALAAAIAAALIEAPLVAAHAQTTSRTAPARAASPPRDLVADDRSGPRVGAAYIVGGSVSAENQDTKVSPLMTLFGWQTERQFPTGLTGTAVPMTELVFLVGGMEQGAFLPSASWVLGIRQPNGWEAGLGPTLTGAGIQLVAAAGVTRQVGEVNVPITFAIAPGRRGASLSLTTGFNVRHGR